MGIRRVRAVLWVAGVLAMAGAVSSLTQSGEALAAGQGPFNPVPGSPFATGANPLSVAFSPDGTLAAVANSGDNTLSVYSVAAGGALTPVPGSPLATGHDPVAVAFDPNPQAPFIAVANATDKSISSFVVTPGGIVSVGASSTASGKTPETLAFNPAGTLLASGNADASVSVFNVGFDGGLSEVLNSPFAVANRPWGLAFSPSGHLLATADANADEVSIYAITDAGAIAGAIAGTPLSTGASSFPKSVSFSHDGSLLAAADRDANAISVWKVGAGETFSAATGSPFPAGATAPITVQFSPATAVLATGNSDGTASLFSVTGAGVLAPLAGSPLRAGHAPTTISFGRAGGLLAAVGEDPDNTVSVYSVGAPSAVLADPAAGAIYARAQSVTTAFSCADATAAPGISSCTDSNGATGGTGHLDTGTFGPHHYGVTAVSADGQTTHTSLAYTVAAPPTIVITSPAEGGNYEYSEIGTKVAYSCTDGSFGPGIKSCRGRVRSGATVPLGPPVSTQFGPDKRTFTVTATSLDGQRATKTITYTVGPPPGMTMQVNPAIPGTLKRPAPIEVSFHWSTLGATHSNPQQLLLPSDFLPDDLAFHSCPNADANATVLPPRCQRSIMAIGTLETSVPGNEQDTCRYTLTLLRARGAPGPLMRFDPVAHSGCPRSATLSVAVVGVARTGHHKPFALTITYPPAVVAHGAQLGNTDLVFVVQNSRHAQTSFLHSTGCRKMPLSQQHGWLAELRLQGSPGGEWSILNLPPTASPHATLGGFLPVLSATFSCVSGRNVSLDGTVVHQIRRTQSYVIATSTGRLTVVHASTSEQLPAVGSVAEVLALPLVNGTYRETRITVTHTTSQARLKGTVTFVSDSGRYYVVSAPGASVALFNLAKHARLPALQEDVRVAVRIVHGHLVQRGFMPLGRHKGTSCVEGQIVSTAPTPPKGAEPGDWIQLDPSDTSSGHVKDAVLLLLSPTQYAGLLAGLPSAAGAAARAALARTPFVTACGTGERAQQGTLGHGTTASFNKITDLSFDTENPEAIG